MLLLAALLPVTLHSQTIHTNKKTTTKKSTTETGAESGQKDHPPAAPDHTFMLDSPLPVQTFTLPATLPIPPDPGWTVVWLLCGVTLVSFLSAMILVLAKQKLSLAALAPAAAPLDDLGNSLRSLQKQAEDARRLYEAAGKDVSERDTPPPPPPPKSEQPVKKRIPELTYKSKPYQPPQVDLPLNPPQEWDFPKAPSGVVAQYQRVRASSDPREIERFDDAYHFTRISCLNFDDLRTNPSASLRFQEAPRGSLLVVNDNARYLAFPWFATDLVQERDRLEGMFQYHDSGSTNLRLMKPAVLDRQGPYWVMREPGSVQADV